MIEMIITIKILTIIKFTGTLINTFTIFDENDKSSNDNK